MPARRLDRARERGQRLGQRARLFRDATEQRLLAALEPTARGPYCGSLGYVGFDGSLDTSILIRTFTFAGGWYAFPVGGGVVADSRPDQEYDETLHKAAGMLRALG